MTAALQVSHVSKSFPGVKALSDVSIIFQAGSVHALLGENGVAAHAHGESWVYGAGELRHKETDRIEALVDALRAIGVRAKGHDEGFSVTGVPSRPKGGKVDSRGDHRIAMLGAVAGLSSREGVEVLGAESVGVSFPGFYDLLDQITHR